MAQAYDEFAARGFSEPGGELNRRVTEARAEALAARQRINRDVYIQDQTVAIDAPVGWVGGGCRRSGSGSTRRHPGHAGTRDSAPDQ
ncbi:hypothetical protein [Rhodanobacter lindaniclasticus]